METCARATGSDHGGQFGSDRANELFRKKYALETSLERAFFAGKRWFWESVTKCGDTLLMFPYKRAHIVQFDLGTGIDWTAIGHAFVGYCDPQARTSAVAIASSSAVSVPAPSVVTLTCR